MEKQIQAFWRLTEEDESDHENDASNGHPSGNARSELGVLGLRFPRVSMSGQGCGKQEHGFVCVQCTAGNGYTVHMAGRARFCPGESAYPRLCNTVNESWLQSD